MNGFEVALMPASERRHWLDTLQHIADAQSD